MRQNNDCYDRGSSSNQDSSRLESVVDTVGIFGFYFGVPQFSKFHSVNTSPGPFFLKGPVVKMGFVSINCTLI